MNFHCYARLDGEQERSNFRARCAGRFELSEKERMAFYFDGDAGQRGWNQALRSAKADREAGAVLLMLNHFSDIGRDLIAAIKEVVRLIDDGFEVYVLEATASFGPRSSQENEADCIIRALAHAAELFVSRNRRVGIESARASGAQIGRPRGKTLADVREIIKRFMDANAGDLPPVRKLAELADIGNGTAGKLLKQFRDERAAFPNTSASFCAGGES